MERFADQLDRAFDEQQKELERNLAAALASKENPLRAVGSCYNCDEPLAQGMRFCDAHCRDDYEARMAARKRA